MQYSEQKNAWVRHENLIWVLVAQGVVILPILLHLPIWLSAVWFVILIWRIQIYRERLHFPSFWVKVITGIIVIAGLILSLGSVNGLDALVGFLVCSFVLKLVEFKTRKDALLLIFIGFVTVATHFLFSQTFFTSLYGIFSCLMLITAWKTIYGHRQQSNIEKIKQGGVLVLHSMPLLLVFFIIMPRISPLWNVPVPGSPAKTGFSDSMSPGDIGDLVKSKGTAFRVEFKSQRPPNNNLYWRALVLDHFDGRKWTLRTPTLSYVKNTQKNPQNTASTTYTVTLEPHGWRWLFSLVEPIAVRYKQGRAEVDDRLLIYAQEPITSRVQYDVTSVFTNQAWGEKQLDPDIRKANLHLPSGFNPKTQQLVNEWQLQGLSDREMIKKALANYNQRFIYTLRPPVLGRDSIDDFLFNTQRGFCEHFSSSFVVMMRLAGIPARLVVGYQGGLENEVDNYLIVKQSDAHAWAEVWLQGQGWLRVDPTSAVAPQRIENGLSDALSESDLQLVGANSFENSPWLKHLQHRIDAFGYAWNRWVLSYDNSLQKDVFEKLLGGTQLWRVAIAFMASVVLIGLFFFAYFYFRNRLAPASKEVQLMRTFVKKARRLEVEYHQGETISDFAKRLGREKPELAKLSSVISDLFDSIAYGHKEENIEKLDRFVLAFPKYPKTT